MTPSPLHWRPLDPPTSEVVAARLGSDVAPRPVLGTSNAGFEEWANGDDIDVFLCVCGPGNKYPSDGDDAGPSDPAGEQLNAGLALIAYSPPPRFTCSMYH
jgi:hypothetical protein